MKRLAIISIEFISKFFHFMNLRSCRYYPTCSRYAIGAYNNTHFFRATRLTLHRVLRCHPFSPGGYDPLPESKD